MKEFRHLYLCRLSLYMLPCFKSSRIRHQFLKRQPRLCLCRWRWPNACLKTAHLVVNRCQRSCCLGVRHYCPCASLSILVTRSAKDNHEGHVHPPNTESFLKQSNIWIMFVVCSSQGFMFGNSLSSLCSSSSQQTPQIHIGSHISLISWVHISLVITVCADTCNVPP